MAQLFVGQANLKPATAEKLKKLVPGISAADLELMQQPPIRSFDPALQQDPFVYRLIEAVQHYGRGLKLIANEKFGKYLNNIIYIFSFLTLLNTYFSSLIVYIFTIQVMELSQPSTCTCRWTRSRECMARTDWHSHSTASG